jgi:hypothetical protein
VLLLATSVTSLLVQSRIYESPLKVHFCQFAGWVVLVAIADCLLGQFLIVSLFRFGLFRMRLRAEILHLSRRRRNNVDDQSEQGCSWDVDEFGSDRLHEPPVPAGRRFPNESSATGDEAGSRYSDR